MERRGRRVDGGNRETATARRETLNMYSTRQVWCYLCVKRDHGSKVALNDPRFKMHANVCTTTAVVVKQLQAVSRECNVQARVVFDGIFPCMERDERFEQAKMIF